MFDFDSVHFAEKVVTMLQKRNQVFERVFYGDVLRQPKFAPSAACALSVHDRECYTHTCEPRLALVEPTERHRQSVTDNLVERHTAAFQNPRMPEHAGLAVTGARSENRGVL